MDKHRRQEITEVEVAAEEEPEGGELLEEQGIGLVTNYFPCAASYETNLSTLRVLSL